MTVEQQKKLIGSLTQLDSVEGDPAWECVQTRSADTSTSTSTSSSTSNLQSTNVNVKLGPGTGQPSS